MAVLTDKETTVVNCECTIIHEDAVAKVKTVMPAPESVFDLADFFKTLGDSTRIGILSALKQSELCVCDIAAVLNMTHSAVSHQLRLLKQARLVSYRKDGKIVYYSLADSHIDELLTTVQKHLTEE